MAYVMIFVFCSIEVHRDFQSTIFPNNIIVFQVDIHSEFNLKNELPGEA